MREIKVNELKEGMTTAVDVFSPKGQLILKRHQTVSAFDIAKFGFYNIASVYVEGSSAQEKEEWNKKYAIIKEKYRDSIDNLHEYMNDILYRDIIFGSIATLLGALGTYFLRKKKFVYTLPPVIANIIIVPLVLRYGYGFTTIYKGVDISLLFNAVTVGIGEIISICVLGSLLKGILSKYRNVIFKQDEA